jgi:hypothetical protein
MKLSNAQALKAEHPDSFYAPDLDELRQTVKPGDFLKVCASGAPGETFGERFWIEVESVTGDTVTGTVANNPIDHPLKFGDDIETRLDEVYQHVPASRPR